MKKFNITLIDSNVITDVEKVTNKSQINNQVMLFYELGYKPNINSGPENGNWVRHGVFKEILDINEFLEQDTRINDIDYINHHNFVFKNK